MSQYMPKGGFKWVDPSLDGFNYLTDTSLIRLVYEVNISYPDHLHHDHNDLPLLPNNSIPPNSKIQKLMATFYKLSRYVLHYCNLQQAISYGLKVEKIKILHSIILLLFLYIVSFNFMGTQST